MAVAVSLDNQRKSAMKKIFVGGLPKSMTDEKLKEFFSGYGDIIDFVVMKDSHTKESRGFGFIEYDKEDPINEILASRPHIIDGREIEVRRAMPKDITHNTIHERTKRLFIGGLNYDVTAETLREYYSEKFEKYGKVESVEIKKDRDTNSSRGFGFVTFDSEDAVDVVLILDPRPIQFGRNCEVKKSEPRNGDEYGPKRSQRPPPPRRRSPPRARRQTRYEERYYDYSPPHHHYRSQRPQRYDREPYARNPPTYSKPIAPRSYPSPPYQGGGGRYANEPLNMHYGSAPSMSSNYERPQSSYPHYQDSYSTDSRNYNDAPSQPGSGGGYNARLQSFMPISPVNTPQGTRSTGPIYPSRSGGGGGSGYQGYEPGYREQDMNPY